MIWRRQNLKTGVVISAVIAALSFFIPLRPCPGRRRGYGGIPCLPARQALASLLVPCAFVAGSFIFGLGSPVAAAGTFTYPDFTIGSDADGEEWGVGALAGGAITHGVLTFDAKGFQMGEDAKRQVFAMYDDAAPSFWDNHGYYMQLRKRVMVPQANNQPGLQFKGGIDCIPFDPEANFGTEDWDPDMTYSFTVEWDDSTATVTMENESGDSWSGEVGYVYPFLAQEQVIVFGVAGKASSSAFPAEPGLEYSNISLEAQVIKEFDDLDGYPPCDETFPSDPQTREDEPGTDSGDPYDDPNNPYDQCACEPVDGLGEMPCEDLEAGSDEIDLPAAGPFRISVKTNDAGIPTGLEVEPVWTFDDIAEALFGKEEASQSNPAIDLKVSSSNATTGEEMNVVIAPQNFHTQVRNLYLNWCLTRGDTGATQSYNEVIAGGTLAQTYQPQSWASGGCCSPLTRAVTEDRDNDGMDDNWEREKFLGKTVNGVVVTEDNMDSVVKPDDDLDHDGYFAQKFINQDGRPVTAAPALADHLGRFYFPGGPEAKLTNVMEFILGTDPWDGDSDNDGWGDGMDYMGIGATSFSFPIDLTPGPNGYYLVTSSAVGINANGLVSIAARSKRIEVPEGQTLEVNLSGDQPNLVVDERFPGGSLKLTAAISGPEVKPEDLYYEWFFNGRPVCDLPNYQSFCQVGRDTIELGGADTGGSLLNLPGLDGDPTKVQPGTPYLFAVRVTDPTSRRSADSSLYLPMAAALHLTTACSPGASDSPDLPTDTGEATTICVEELQTGGIPAGSFANTNWQWSLNGNNLQQQSGLGKSILALTPTALAGSQQIVNVQIYDVAAGGMLAQASRNFAATGTQVNIIEPAGEFYGGGRGADQRLVRGRPGETIHFVATAQDFPTSAEVTFSWQAGGVQSAGVGQTTFDYAIPADTAAGQDIPVTVMAQSGSAGSAILTATDQVTLLVGEATGGSTAWGERISTGLAAAASLIPGNLSLAFKIIISLMVIGGVAWVVLRFTKLISS